MKYDIYFHNDFDGRASAAVMLSFLQSRGDDIEHFTTIDFYLQKEWLDERFFDNHTLFKGKRNPVIVVDFFYHPQTIWWFDHHITTFRKERWKARFKKSKKRVLDPRYPSCCHLVYASLKTNFGWKPPKNITELMHLADMIDGAQYKTAKETIYLDSPVLEVDAFIDETRHDPAIAERMVKLLAEKPMPWIAAQPHLKSFIKKSRAKNIKALEFYEKNMKIFGKASFIDLTKAKVETLRYASYYLYPKVPYAIRFTTKDGHYHVGIGSNPWIKNNPVHIGKLLTNYGGGGHKGAGAVDFSSRREALDAVPKLIDYLNNKNI